MSRIILGGGLSGLATGYYALKQQLNQPIVILESTERLGGWLKTTRLTDGTLFEQSARTIRPGGLTGANTLQLVEELGLAEEVIPVYRKSAAATNRMIYANGSLHTLPNSLFGLFKTQEPFSKPLVYSLLNDFITPKKSVQDNDESLYSFASRRFGDEVADYLVSPIVSGICGGDAKEISVKFMMKSLFEKEQRYGSVVRGMIFDTLKGKNRTKQAVPKSRLLRRSQNERWNVYSFRKGIEVLPKSLKRQLEARGADIRTDSEVSNIELNKHSVVCQTANGNCIVGNRLFSCVPAYELSRLLQSHHPELSKILSGIRSASMCVINLKYDGKILSREGFGFLVAPKEESPLLGVIFDSCCFPYRDGTVLTAMIGGYKYNKYIKSSTTEHEAVNVALQELKRMLRIDEQPTSFQVRFLNNCIPQYTVGHETKVKAIEDYISAYNLPLSVCGASYYGVGVNDVIYSAKRAIEQIRD